MKLKELESEDQNTITSFYISFSDLMVLLGVFFVMLLSMSRIDTGSFEKIKSGFSGSTKGTLVELAQSLKDIAETYPKPLIKPIMIEWRLTRLTPSSF